MHIKISHFGKCESAYSSNISIFQTNFSQLPSEQLITREKNQDNFHLGKFCDDKQIASFTIHGSE